MKYLRWSFLQKLLTVFNRWLFLQSTSYQVFHTVVNMPLIRLNKILVRCHWFHKKLGLVTLQISSTLKFNFIFTLPCGETLLITNSIHKCLRFQIDSSMQLNSYDINQPLFTVQIHHNNYRQTFSNFFGGSKEIQIKLHSIALTLW